jgi:hypothetical protein
MSDFEHSYYLANAEAKRLEAAIVTWKEEEVAWKETEAALLARVVGLEEENEKLRNIEIIQDGCHTRVIIGDSSALPFTIHKKVDPLGLHKEVGGE